jgi:hypothetical protein
MTVDPRPIVLLLDRIDRSARLETLCHEFDNGVAKAFRGTVPSEFQDLIDQAIRAVERLPDAADELGRPVGPVGGPEELLDLAL